MGIVIPLECMQSTYSFLENQKPRIPPVEITHVEQIRGIA